MYMKEKEESAIIIDYFLLYFVSLCISRICLFKLRLFLYFGIFFLKIFEFCFIC